MTVSKYDNRDSVDEIPHWWWWGVCLHWHWMPTGHSTIWRAAFLVGGIETGCGNEIISLVWDWSPDIISLVWDWSPDIMSLVWDWSNDIIPLVWDWSPDMFSLVWDWSLT